jgi:hypothetical protein
VKAEMNIIKHEIKRQVNFASSPCVRGVYATCGPKTFNLVVWFSVNANVTRRMVAAGAALTAALAEFVFWLAAVSGQIKFSKRSLDQRSGDFTFRANGNPNRDCALESSAGLLTFM